MTLALGLLFALVAAVFVALPFIRPPAEMASPRLEAGNRVRWERQKHDAYAAIKEAEFDLRMAKLSDADFAAVREKYGHQALEAIAALDEKTAKARVIGGRKPARMAYCPACGHTVLPRANFCASCGRSLAEAVA